MLTRREFIRTAALFALAPRIFAEHEREIWVNDVHSQLNRTRVRELLMPRTRDELAEIVRSASKKGLPISVGYRAETNRRRHIHAGGKSVVECTRARTGNEAADFQLESFTLTNADGKSIRCSRDENNELFRVAIGGYGLFGLIDSVTFRLVPRQSCGV
jgi:FAD/FMN-containing dehydrogenase